MMDAFDLASRLFGNSRAESRGDVSNSLDMLTATGAGTSEDGAATVYIDADITPADDFDGDDSTIDVPTSPAVVGGDDVLIGLTGSGALKTPVIISNPGSGDRMQVQISNAETLAEQAEAVATATGQHFWHDTDGAHVTEAERDDWETAQTGANSLWNSLGMLFRDGLNNLLAVLTSGIAIYDGNGNDASNILAEFMADHVRVGGAIPTDGTTAASVQFFDGSAEYGTALDATEYADDGNDYHSLISGARLHSRTHDGGTQVSTGSVGESSLEMGQSIDYGISGPGEYQTEATVTLTAYAQGGIDPTQTAISSASIGVKAVTIDDDYERSYVTINGNDVTTEQALIGLSRPMATYTGSSSTTTDTASGWKLTWFNVTLATNGPVSDYFTNSNGVITAVRDCKLLISCSMRWQDSVAGQRGIGLFTEVNGGDSGGTETCSTFGYFSQTANSNRSVYMPPRLFSLAAGDHITIRRNTQNNAKYTNGPNMSWLTIEVVG